MSQKISTDKIATSETNAPRRETGLAAGRLKVGDVLGHRELVTIQGNSVQIPDPELLVHLQFRRYAGCPVCNLHLRSIARLHGDILAAGVREVVVFYSDAETMLGFQGAL
ncbi:MAG: hypothetical protein OK474_08615, partial [Thaumarchaeota archaeon]|nr:hypothetical protein [Nitrososphaerota archaeon]